MKKSKSYKTDRKALLSDLSSKVNSLLARNNVRASLIIAYVFTVSMAGLGLIISYLLLNTLEYCSVKITDTIGYLVMFVFVFLFTPPAFASVRITASAICDGREVSLPEIFAVFSNFKSFLRSYLPIKAFSWIPKSKRGQGKSYWSDLLTAIKARMIYANAFKFLLDILLSFATCFIYYILVAGPRAAVRHELIIRNINNINLKNNERTVKRND